MFNQMTNAHLTLSRVLLACSLVSFCMATSQASGEVFTVQGQPGRTITFAGTGLAGTPIPRGWFLRGRPTGSQARVDDPKAVDLRFIPDLPGVYLAEGLGTGGKEQAPLRVKVYVGPKEILAPVQTWVPGAGGTRNIVVDGNSYPGAGTAGISILTLLRKTLQKVSFYSSDFSQTSVDDAKTYLDNILAKQGNDVIVVICSGQRFGANISILAPELEHLGGTTIFESIADPNFAFSFIGSPNLKAGQAYQVGNDGLNGYFAPDINGNYTFMNLDYALFSIRAETNSIASVIQVGSGLPWSPDPAAAGVGGFFVAVVDAASLNSIYSGTYESNSASQMEALATKLNSYIGAVDKIVFVSTYGTPHDSTGGPSEYFDVAQAITNLGGTYESILNFKPGGWYALVSSPHAAHEAGSAVKVLLVNPPNNAAPSVLRGVLARGRQGNWYHPIASGNESSNLQLYSILGQQPQAWPHPAPGDASEQTAYQNISLAVTHYSKDVRQFSYSDLVGFIPTTAIDTLEGLLDPSTNAVCSYAANGAKPVTPFCKVAVQLHTEFSYVALIRAFDAQLSAVQQDQNTMTLNLMPAVVQVIDSSLKTSESPVPSIIENVISTVLSIAGAVTGPAAPVFGTLSALFSFGTNLMNEIDGNSAVLDVTVPASQVASQASDIFVKQAYLRGIMFDSVYQDWGKLNTLAQALESGTNDSTSPWYWGDTTTAELLKGLQFTTERSLYKSLLKPVYTERVWWAQDDHNKTPGNYSFISYAFTYSMFQDWRSDAWLTSPSHRSLNGKFENDILVFAKQGQYTYQYAGGFSYAQPSSTLTKKLFGAYDPTLDVTDPNRSLGIYKPEFYRQWTLPTYYCSAPGMLAEQHCYPQGCSTGPYSNCDYATPQLPH